MSDQLSEDLASLKISRDAPKARRPLGKVFLGLLVLAVLAGTAIRWGLPALETQFFKTEVEVTEIALVSAAGSQVTLTSTGFVVPQTVAKVASKVTGRIAKVRVTEGIPVARGDVLFELDARDQESAVSSGRARAGAANARAATARARAEVARANLKEVTLQRDRQKRLAESGAVPTTQAEDLEARAASASEQVKASEQEAAAAAAEAQASHAEVDTLRVGLSNWTIVAPISGTVMNKPREVGDVTGPETTLVELADFSTLLVETDVPEARLSLAKPGAPCEIVLEAYPDRRYRGKVVELGPKVNRAKATGLVKVAFVDEKEGVLPEMSARVSFLSKELDPNELKIPPKKVVPRTALVETPDGAFVFVLDQGRVRRVPVTKGPMFGTGFELRDGPAAGTKVVKSPPPHLTDAHTIKEKT